MNQPVLMPNVCKDSLALVPQEFIPHEWPKVHDMLKPAVERSGGRWTMAHLLMSLCMGEQQLWVWLGENGDRESAITTQIVHYPNKMILAFQFLGGKGFDEWSGDMLATLEDYAIQSGCHGMEAVARFGFWPFFKKEGFEKAYCTYHKLFERTE